MRISGGRELYRRGGPPERWSFTGDSEEENKLHRNTIGVVKPILTDDVRTKGGNAGKVKMSYDEERQHKLKFFLKESERNQKVIDAQLGRLE